MNIQERDKLTGFLAQLTQAQAGAKDAEAETLIRQACARQPDAAYLLVQRALLLEGALQDAQAQVARLQTEVNQLRAQQGAGSPGGFFDVGGWGNSAGSVRTAAPAPMPTQQSVPPQPAAPRSALPGFLGSVATTAAGVVAGSFLFQGIEHLLGSHGNGWMSPAAGLPLAQPTENVVVNNYYENDADTDNADIPSFDEGMSGSGDDWV